MADNDNKIPISDIKIGPRFRKDLGDIEGLAAAITATEGQLIHPVVINQNNELIAGARRLEACKLLGWTDIPITVVLIQDIIKGEFYENVSRKDFTVSERVAILEEIERQRIGHRQKKGMEKDSKLESFQIENKNKRSVDIVARFARVSQGQLANEKKLVRAVSENPDDIVDATTNQRKITLREMMEKVDKRRMKVGTALILLRRYEYCKDLKAKHEAARRLPPPPPLTDKEKQDLKAEQDRIIDEAFEKYFFNKNEYEDDYGLRLIPGNFLEVSANTKFIEVPVNTVVLNKRIRQMQLMKMDRCGIQDHSVDLIFTNPSYALDMIPVYENYKKGYQNPPTYRDLSYFAERVLKEGGNIVIGIQPQFHNLIPTIVYFMSHTCDNERHSNYGLFHTSVNCDRCSTKFSQIIICDSHLLLLWFTKRNDNSSDGNNNNQNEEEKFCPSIDDVIKRFTSDENDVVLDPLMDHGDIGIVARKLGCRFIGIEKDNERFKTAQLKMEKDGLLDNLALENQL